MGLNDILPAKARKVAYAVYAFLGLGLGATFAGYAAVPDATVPTWVVVVLAVYTFVGAPLGFTAAANTTPVVNPTPVTVALDAGAARAIVAGRVLPDADAATDTTR